LIDAERIDSGRLHVQRRRTHLAPLVDDVLEVARSGSDLKGVALHASVDSFLPPLTIDGLQMTRVIANLLGNAVKFTPAGGGVRLTVTCQGDRVLIAVADDGPGIPPEELPRLAERHFRGSRSRGVDGSGLGLFIVRAVVEAHGGTLRIVSSVGRGTTVSVSLPMDPVADMPSSAARLDALPAASNA